MNERIKELARQCYSEVEGLDCDGGYTYTEKFNYEKFAELIVRQCSSIAFDFVGGNSASREIKEYFGVAE